MTVDWLSVFGIAATLVVALFAVWLGYRYQIQVADREQRRKAYLDAVAALNELSELIEVTEQLVFATRENLRGLANSVANPDKDHERALQEARVRVFVAVVNSGASPDFDSISTDPETRMRSEFGLGTMAAYATIIRRSNEVRRRFNHALLVAFSGMRVTLFHHPQKSVDALNALHRAYTGLDSVLQELANPMQPHQVNWEPIDQIVSAAINRAYQDIGIMEHTPLDVTHKREHIPWSDNVESIPRLVKN